MLQVKNQTPLTAALFVFPDPGGIDTAYIAIKGTFAFGPRGVRLADEQQTIVVADECRGEAGRSSLKRAGEAHCSKPATDILLSGTAYAPRGRPSPRFQAAIRVGMIQKIVQVSGERVWRVGPGGLAPSSPTPIVDMPLTFERAYGGRHELEGDGFLAEMRNPVGIGFRGKRRDAEMNGTPVPNLEDPRELIQSLADRPAPAAFGPVAPGWLPRISHAGTYDEQWLHERAPYLPLDFDARFLQTASPDQVYPGYLQGGEPVTLVNVTSSGSASFSLPLVRLDVQVRIAGRWERPPAHIETLSLEPDDQRFTILWRAAVACKKTALDAEWAIVTIQSIKGVLS